MNTIKTIVHSITSCYSKGLRKQMLVQKLEFSIIYHGFSNIHIPNNNYWYNYSIILFDIEVNDASLKVLIRS